MLRQRYGLNFLLHIEFMKVGGRVIPASIPVVRFTTEQRLNDMIAYCREIGVSVSNPHTCMVDAGAPMDPSDPKIAAKHNYDPRSLLNPGKINGYPLPDALAITS